MISRVPVSKRTEFGEYAAHIQPQRQHQDRCDGGGHKQGSLEDGADGEVLLRSVCLWQDVQ